MIDEGLACILGGLYVFTRLLGLLVLLPFWSNGTHVVGKTLLAFVLGVGFRNYWPFIEQFSILGLILEFTLGLIISLPVIIIVDLMLSVGEIFDAGRGQTIAAQYNPFGVVPESITALLFKNVFWAVLLFGGVFEQLLLYFAESLVSILPGSLKSTQLLKTTNLLVEFVPQLCQVVFYRCIPLLIVFLAIDTLIAFLQLILPQVSLQAESFLAKTFIVISAVTILLAWGGLEIWCAWAASLVKIGSELVKVVVE